MSKPSTTPTPKVSTRPPRKPASANRHPQAETSISTPSKSSQSLTSPSKNATNQLDQKDIATMDGINIPPRGSIGALKSNSVTSGSTNEDSTMLPTYPANASSAKTEDIKSFEPVLVESCGGMPLPSLWNQQARSSSLNQSSSTSNPPLPTFISPATVKLVVPSSPDTGSTTSKVDILSLSPTPSRKVKKLTSKFSQKSPPSLSITPQMNLDPLPPDPSTAFPTPSSGLIPVFRNHQDNLLALNVVSCLATARVIEDLSQISYPEGVMGPKPELNVKSEKGKFRYDREFLLQFLAICTEKPDIPLGIIGSEGNQPHVLTVRQSKPRTSSGSTMGTFSTPSSKMTSEERFAAKPNSVPDRGKQQTPLTETGDQGVPRSNRTRSKRGGARNKDQAPSLELVVPREVAGNRLTRKSPADGENDVERRVRVLLNKLTAENFDAVSDQIVAWANKSGTEKDCRSLVNVTGLVFENAINEAAWSGLYARLCKKIMGTINPNIRDDGVRRADGKPITGGQLFRKYLMNLCQVDFNRGWAVKDVAVMKTAGSELYSGDSVLA